MLGQSAVVAAFIALAASLGTTVINIFFSERWKTRFAREDKAKELLAHYREPLVRAAFDLQSRLYNIVRQDFLHNFSDPMSQARYAYAEASSLWLIGQWFAWNEIIRREIQLLDLGDPLATANLQRRLLNIAGLFGSKDPAYKEFQVRRAEQRAIGELLVVERKVSTGVRSDAMGYAEFCENLGGPGFAEWFTHLRTSLLIAKGTVGYSNPRLVLLQREFIDLIDYLDTGSIRYPSAKEREKLPEPTID